jgi:hypothetical protein
VVRERFDIRVPRRHAFGIAPADRERVLARFRSSRAAAGRSANIALAREEPARLTAVTCESRGQARPPGVEVNTPARLFAKLAVSVSWVAMFAVCNPANADEPDVVAINVLAVPDGSMRDYARQLNERLRREDSQSFALDETHVPHISILHRFVAAKDLPQIYAAVRQVLQKHPLQGKTLEATGIEHSRWGDTESVSITIASSPQLTALQRDLIAALRPHPTPTGSRAAFVTSPGPSDIDAETVQYVKTFEQKQAGDSYKPHITVGLADSATAEQLQSQLLAPRKFTIEAIAIYQLGNVGTARKQLWPSKQ